MSRLTYRKRQKLRKNQFAIPQQRKYPIEDESHARNALARVAQHGTISQKAQVRAAVHKRYPEIDHHGSGTHRGFLGHGILNDYHEDRKSRERQTQMTLGKNDGWGIDMDAKDLEI